MAHTELFGCRSNGQPCLVVSSHTENNTRYVDKRHDSATNRSPPNPLVRTENSRMACPYCGMRIIPRMVFTYGYPVKSVCSFCAGTLWQRPSVKRTSLVRRVFEASLLTGLGLLVLSLFLGGKPP